MSVVDPNEMVEVAVLQERVAVHDVHDDVECREGDEAVDGEGDPLGSEEGQDLFEQRIRFAGLLPLTSPIV